VDEMSDFAVISFLFFSKFLRKLSLLGSFLLLIDFWVFLGTDGFC